MEEVGEVEEVAEVEEGEVAPGRPSLVCGG